VRVSVVLLILGLFGCTGQVRLNRPTPPLESVFENRACFSPGADCVNQLIQFIQTASQSLDIAIFHITQPEIVHAILLANRRVNVRVLVDKRQTRGDHSLVSTLIKAGVKVRYGRQRGIMHHKFIIVDNRKLETGSFNFTQSAGFRNQENQVYLSDPVVVQSFVEQFEKIWIQSNGF